MMGDPVRVIFNVGYAMLEGGFPGYQLLNPWGIQQHALEANQLLESHSSVSGQTTSGQNNLKPEELKMEENADEDSNSNQAQNRNVAENMNQPKDLKECVKQLNEIKGIVENRFVSVFFFFFNTQFRIL